jgi:plasmid stabilization system protein ParE
MQVRWTLAAANDFEAIADYLFEKAPNSAVEILRRLYNAPALLQQFPLRGRVGKERELVN